MNIEALQKALVIMNKGNSSGGVFAYHDELQLYPAADSFTKDEMAELEKLGFMMNDDDDGGFFCFT